MEIRHYKPTDYAGVIALFEDAYAGIDDNFASFEDMEALRLHFPEGQIVAEESGQVVGLILSLYCPYEIFTQPQPMADIYDARAFGRYNAEADSLFALEILVRSDQKRKGIGKRLNAALRRTMEQHNLRAFIGVSRIPGYSAVQADMSVETYVQKVLEGTLTDAALSYNCANRMLPRLPVPDYYPPDVASAGYGVLVVQENLRYQPDAVCCE
jgi:predicted N-acetyltransferase YhbS